MVLRYNIQYDTHNGGTWPRYTRNSDEKSYSSQEIVRAIDTASDSPIVFFAADTSCNRSSDAQISLHNLVPITDFFMRVIFIAL